MTKNRKKTESYRFNGYPHLNPGSILPVKIAELQMRIRELQAKLNDPNDPDDKKWTKNWLDRYCKELEKKQKGRRLKHSEKKIQRRIKPSG